MTTETEALTRLLTDYSRTDKPLLGAVLDELLAEIRVRVQRGEIAPLLRDPWELRILQSLVAEARSNFDSLIAARAGGHEAEHDDAQFAQARVCLQRILNLIDGTPELGDFPFDPHPKTAILSEPDFPWEDQA